MAGRTFEAAVGAFALKSKERMRDVLRTAAQNMFEDVIWRTPRDTGFLVNTLEASLTGPQPIRPEAVPAPDAERNSYPLPEDYAMVVSGMKLGDTIYGSFGAAYARHVEYGTRFTYPVHMVGLAAQNWHVHVSNAVNEVRSRSGGAR